MQAQLDLLAKAGDLLTVELSADARMRSFVALVVPDFADLCMVHQRQEDGSFALVHFAIADPEMVDRFDLVEHWPGVPPDPKMPSVQAATTGRAVLLPEIPDSVFAGLGPEGADLARRLGLSSLLCVPLHGDGPEAFGTVAFVQARSGRRFDTPDIPLAQELVRRACRSRSSTRGVTNASRPPRRRSNAACSRPSSPASARFGSPRATGPAARRCGSAATGTT